MSLSSILVSALLLLAPLQVPSAGAGADAPAVRVLLPLAHQERRGGPPARAAAAPDAAPGPQHRRHQDQHDGKVGAVGALGLKRR